ncbi:MAG TPA: OsmC family protein [Polyangia bacterium]|nr:OsmC family protein [Polyangia bacterium]
MTPPERQEQEPPAPEVLVATAHLESGEAPHAQRIKVGHHVVTADEPTTNGGGDTGPSPTGMMLAALAACTSITLRMYADRKTWDLGGVRVGVKLLRAGGAERIERTIHFGAALAAEQVTRLLEIADKTPVTRMLKAGVPIATRVN